ncbi:MAG TPA: hypothetical protein DCS93_15570 [Microscillaceae bacterium]|nr:hypothetical protein [Microscillaceae bacterium]
MTTIQGNFTVNGVAFADWFNQSFRLTNPKIYSHLINAANFATLMEHIPDFTGKQEISLGEFCGHFAIMYNETGGTFSVIREMGGPKYMFEPTTWGKVTYNKAPNQLAGDQLKAWGVIASDTDVEAWNGSVYPSNASPKVQQAALRCDFYRFRGYGFNQLTWRNNYDKCMQPLLPKPIDEYTEEEFENTIKDISIACKTFHNFITQSGQAQKAISDLEKGDFTAYGMLVSGGWVSYVNNKYVPRAVGIYNALKNAQVAAKEAYAIEGMHLTPQQIKHIQQALINSGNAEATKIINDAGGADGSWGPGSESAYQLVGKSIPELLRAGGEAVNIQNTNENAVNPIAGMSTAEIKLIQQRIMNAGSSIANNGGADGHWGPASQKALDILKQVYEDLTKS